MKKAAIFLLVLLLCACAQPVQKPEFTKESLPRIDGSTATIPYSEGIVRELLGLSPEEAQSFVHHNTTHYAYENLLEGKCDVIFVTPPSEEEYKMLEESGKSYGIVKVLNDAFVFLANVQNPIDDIASEDIRKIYRGEIKNWSEIGGADSEIIPYQRPDNSGSQTLMYKLCVPKNEIMPAPTELKPAEMGDLVDAVSNYESGKAALGYSVYYYASGMYTDAGSKLIAVDGVYPTNETIKDGSYPFVDGYYAIYLGDGESNGVKTLIDYLLSDGGRIIAESSGYVPIK